MKTRRSGSPLGTPFATRGRCLLLLLAGVLAVAWLPRDRELLKMSDQIFGEVSRLRGLEILTPVDKGIKSSDEIRELLHQKILEEIGEERVERERRLLVRMGLMPEEYDYLGSVLELLDEQIAGFYDPKTKSLSIASWLTAEQQKETLAHELVHALQDQHFDLAGLLEAVKDNDDELMARKAIVEGEALVVALDHTLQPFRRDFLTLPNLDELLGRSLREAQEQSKALKNTPRFIRELFVFPYLHGARFLQVYRRWHPWEDVAKLYQDPPRSTEQILHPEKYTSRRDDPTPLDRSQLPSSLEGPWAVDYSAVMGEYTVYLWLREFVPEPTARRASAGWDGDVFQLLGHADGHGGWSLHSVWDGPRDAAQFFEALGRVVQARYPGAEQLEESEERRTWRIPGLILEARIDGDRVQFWEVDQPAEP